MIFAYFPFPTGFLFSHLEAIATGVDVEKQSLTLITLGKSPSSLQFPLFSTASFPPGTWVIIVESVFMFVSSLVVFIHIALGGVVGLDIRRSICLRDLLFGAFLSILVSFYTITKFFFRSSVDRKNLDVYDSHIMHTLVNLILLENLLMNRSAMAYWRQISCRLMNNWPALRSPKVAAGNDWHHLMGVDLITLG